MVLCLVSRDSRGDTTKQIPQKTIGGPEIAILRLKLEIFIQDQKKKGTLLHHLRLGRQRLLFDGLVLQEDRGV